jgi:5-methylcytosine-specific restriction endonuclease McrA
MRLEFTAKTKLAAWDRCRGHCQRCTAKVIGRPEYDHIIPAAIGGGNDLGNCHVLCRTCHGLKTTKTDVPQIAKTKRVKAKRANAQRIKSRPMAGTKASGLRRRMDGTVERR